VPLLSELAQNDEQRRMLQFVSEAAAMDGPLAGPPGIPAEALGALRTAFNAMTADPAFRAEAEKLRIDLGPLTGDEVGKLAVSIMGTPAATIEKVKSIIAPPKDSESKPAPARPN
jgi:hypothetical protein